MTSLVSHIIMKFWPSLLLIIDVWYLVMYFHTLSIWTLGHCNTLLLFFFRHSVEDLLLCLDSLSCCMTQFESSFSCWTDWLTFDFGILWYTEKVDSMTTWCPSPLGPKQIQIISCWVCASAGPLVQTYSREESTTEQRSIGFTCYQGKPGRDLRTAL